MWTLFLLTALADPTATTTVYDFDGTDAARLALKLAQALDQTSEPIEDALT